MFKIRWISIIKNKYYKNKTKLNNLECNKINTKN